ncbi:hypothetical protein FACS1894159_11550 [Bacteroidia bacterium]|nr:hypothetical protein FACS1894159_11550 [Bacteroidia bacterium]
MTARTRTQRKWDAWFRDLLAWPLKGVLKGDDLTGAVDVIMPSLVAQAEKLPPGAGGIVATDWLNGRRTPFADQTMTGTISGLTLGSTAPMIFRALVEATCFGSKAIIDHLRAEGVQVRAINAIGGISSKSPMVMQIMADVLDMPIRVMRSGQACALGAAMYAAAASGIHTSISEAQKAMSAGYMAEYTPEPDAHKAYMDLYQKYRRLLEVRQ